MLVWLLLNDQRVNGRLHGKLAQAFVTDCIPPNCMCMSLVTQMLKLLHLSVAHRAPRKTLVMIRRAFPWKVTTGHLLHKTRWLLLLAMSSCLGDCLNVKEHSDTHRTQYNAFLCVLCMQGESCQPSYCCIGSLLLLLFFLALTVTGIALVESHFNEIGVTSRFMPYKMNKTTDCEREAVGELVHLDSMYGGNVSSLLWVLCFMVVEATVVCRVITEGTYIRAWSRHGPPQLSLGCFQTDSVIKAKVRSLSEIVGLVHQTLPYVGRCRKHIHVMS